MNELMMDEFEPAPEDGGFGPTDAPPPDAAGAKDAFEWQQSRRRPDGNFAFPMRGFGATGAYTLWLPSAEVFSQNVFRDGRFFKELVKSAMGTEEMLKLRRSTIRAIATPEGRQNIDLALGGYAIKLIRDNYQLTDGEVTMLMQGDKWHQDVKIHLLGGRDEVDRLVQIDMETALSLILSPIDGPSAETSDTFNADPDPASAEAPNVMTAAPKPMSQTGPVRPRRWSKWLTMIQSAFRSTT